MASHPPLLQWSQELVPCRERFTPPVLESPLGKAATASELCGLFCQLLLPAASFPGLLQDRQGATSCTDAGEATVPQMRRRPARPHPPWAMHVAGLEAATGQRARPPHRQLETLDCVETLRSSLRSLNLSPCFPETERVVLPLQRRAQHVTHVELQEVTDQAHFFQLLFPVLQLVRTQSC